MAPSTQIRCQRSVFARHTPRNPIWGAGPGAGSCIDIYILVPNTKVNYEGDTESTAGISVKVVPMMHTADKCVHLPRPHTPLQPAHSPPFPEFRRCHRRFYSKLRRDILKSNGMALTEMQAASFPLTRVWGSPIASQSLYFDLPLQASHDHIASCLIIPLCFLIF